MHVLLDWRTMMRRNLLHLRRYPSLIIVTVAMPVIILLLFTQAFGGALGAGIGTESYIDYITPGILLMAAASGATATAVAVNNDMTEGIINRFRTMAIARSSVLAGHVVGSILQTLLAIVVVTLIAVALGFRPDATPLEWLAALGLLTFLLFGMTWLSAAFGLVARNVEVASNLPMPLQFLPFLGSAIVPVATMPAGMEWFAEHQPFTPMIETLRGLLLGTEIGTSWISALAWCAALSVAGFLWARAAFAREPAR